MKRNQIQKTLIFLVDLKGRIESKQDFSVDKLCSVHKLGKVNSMMARRLGLYDKRDGKYVWLYHSTLDFSIAKEVNRMCKEYSKEKNKKRVQEIAQQPTFEIDRLANIERKLDAIINAFNITL